MKGQKPHLIKNGIRIHCNTENFVPIVVLGLSASSSSGSHSSTSMTTSRQEIDHPIFSSSSFASPTTTVLSDSETRKREVLSGLDYHPVSVSNEHVERNATKNPETNEVETTMERRDPLCADTPEWFQEFRENLVDDRVLEHRDSHANSSHGVSLEPTFKRREDQATQWIQAFPCETKTSQETQRSLQKFIYTYNSLAFGRVCEEFPGIIVRRHHTDREQMGLLKEQCAEYRKAPLLNCCNRV